MVCACVWLFKGAMIRNVGVKPTVLMTASETDVTSVTASSTVSAAAMKPYVVAAVVDPSEVRFLAFVNCTDLVYLILIFAHDSLVS